MLLHCVVKHDQHLMVKNLMMNLSHDQRLVLLSQKDCQGKDAKKLAPTPAMKSLIAWICQQSDRYLLAIPPEVVVFHSLENTPDLEDCVRNIEQAFKRLNIKPLTCPDPTKSALMQSVERLQNKGSISGLIVMMVSMGTSETIQTSDGIVSLQHIIQQMDLPCLCGKPKVIIHKGSYFPY